MALAHRARAGWEPRERVAAEVEHLERALADEVGHGALEAVAAEAELAQLELAEARRELAGEAQRAEVELELEARELVRAHVARVAAEREAAVARDDDLAAALLEQADRERHRAAELVVVEPQQLEPRQQAEARRDLARQPVAVQVERLELAEQAVRELGQARAEAAAREVELLGGRRRPVALRAELKAAHAARQRREPEAAEHVALGARRRDVDDVPARALVRDDGPRQLAAERVAA